MSQPEDFEVFEVEVESVAEPTDEPAGAVDPSPLPSLAPPQAVVYLESPNPLGLGNLLAHDRGSVLAALRSGDRRRGLAAGDFDRCARQVQALERDLVRQLAAERRRRLGRTIYLSAVAVGLTFLAASLLGAAGLLLAHLPYVGPLLASVIGSAGASIGGLPLATVVCGVPGAWLVWSHLRGWPAPPRSAKFVESEVFDVGAPMRELLEIVGDSIEEIRALVAGRQTLPQADAIRVAEALFHLETQALRAGVPVAAACYGDLAGRARTASWGSRRWGSRRRLVVAELLTGYQPPAESSGSGWLRLILQPVLGLAVAAALFVMSGIIRLDAFEIELMRTNSIWQPPGAIDYVDLTRLEARGVDFEGSDAAIPIVGPGWFWAPPAPLTRRMQIELIGTGLPVMVDIGLAENDAIANVEASFGYVIDDPRAYGDAVLRWSDPIVQGSQVVEELLAELLENQRAESGDDLAAETEKIKLGIEPILNQLIDASEQDPRLNALGLQLIVLEEFQLGQSDER